MVDRDRRSGGASRRPGGTSWCFVGLNVSEGVVWRHDPARRHLTKTGNKRARKALIEAAWTYSRPAATRKPIAARLPAQVQQIADKARHRLSRRYRQLVTRGKLKQVAIAAVAGPIVGLIVLTILAAAGYVLVRNSLRPLAEVERHGPRDRRRRPVPARAGGRRAHRGRPAGHLAERDARPGSSRPSAAQQASEEQARGSEKRMRRFVADASHELRTPLTSIRGFAELYRQGAVRTDEDVARLMERIEAEGARMGLLVEDLLLLARMDQQRPLTFAPVDLAAIAGDAVHDAKAVAARPADRRCTWTSRSTDVPVVRGDDGRLRQVVGNLVTNALDAHPGRGTRVTVTVGEAADDPAVLVLRVADEGPGMDPADAERAFERFYRADASRTRSRRRHRPGPGDRVLARRRPRRLGRPGHRAGEGHRRHRPAAALRPGGRAPGPGPDGGDAEPA